MKKTAKYDFKLIFRQLLYSKNQAAKLINSIGLEKFLTLTCNTATFSILLFDNLLSTDFSVFYKTELLNVKILRIRHSTHTNCMQYRQAMNT